jgi:signal transduction histidine kinase
VGLTLVRRLSERFDWPIELQSKLGEGTTATVHFPLAGARREIDSIEASAG